MSETAPVLLWGGRGSGKSGFVGALWHAGGAQDDTAGRWCISPGDLHDEHTKNYLIDAYTMLRDERRRATMPSAEYPVLRMTARRWIGGSPRASLELAFRDPAGEYADDPVRARQQGAPLLDDMVGADGVIWLFDCMAESRPRLDQIIRQIGSLRERTGGRAITTPVAFCISRIDLLGDEPRAWVQSQPEAAVRETLGADVMAQLESAFPRRRFFAISSRGLKPGTVEPIGLNDVLSWIHANRRRSMLLGAGRRWRRPIAIAAAALLALWFGARSVDQYLYGEDAQERQRTEQRALGELELAGRLHAQGDSDSAFAVLRHTALSPRHERAIELDTLLAFIAHQLGAARMLSGESADSLLDIAVHRSERAADRIRDTEALARVRFVHAEACMLQRCGSRVIREDLEFVRENSRNPRLVAQARERLAGLER
jgi:hypothetical protein